MTTMDMVLAQRLIFLLVLLGISSCTSTQDERIVPEKVVHFPFPLALRGSTLLVGATSADGKYNSGRLLALSTTAIKAAVDARDKSALKDWNKIVESNVMIPPSIGAISFSNQFIVFPSREAGSLVSLPVQGDKQRCNKPMEQVEACKDSRSLALNEVDPFSIDVIKQTATEEIVVVSYLGASRIDLVTVKKDGLTLRKHFDAATWLRAKSALHEARRAITKKVVVTHRDDPAKATAYFLLEHHLIDFPSFTKPRLSHVLSIKVSDLLTANVIDESKINLIELTDRFSIVGVQDLAIDETTDEAIVLGRMPEALYKIDLSTNALVANNTVCTEATTMAVNKNLDLVVVPCFKDSRVQNYALSTLLLTQSSPSVGRGPAYAVIDEANKLIYCTLNLDGTVVIFDLLLNKLGEIFDKAPGNRVGS